MRDFNRQLGLLDPEEFKGVTISVIGAGATGSHVVSTLAQMGIGYKGNGEIRVFDFDVVEPHNLQNQAFWPKHIGMKKVDALAELVKERFDVEIKPYDMKVVDQKEVQCNYVFLLTDTMASRKEIMEKAMKFAINTELVVETRMGLEEGRVYAFNPNNKLERDMWFGSLYTDEEAETSLCGTSASIVNTAQFITSLAVSRLIHHYRDNKSKLLTNTKRDKIPMWNESIFTMNPENFVVREFGQDIKYLQ